MLSKEQKDELQKMLGPIVKEALESGVTPLIREELKKATEASREADASYVSKILSGSVRAKEAIEEPGAKVNVISRLAINLTLAKGDIARAVAVEKKRYDDDLSTVVIKLLESGDAAEGGVFVPSNLSNDLIDNLRPFAAFRSAMPVTLDLAGGNLTIPGIATDATSEYVGEAKSQNASTIKTRDLNFVSRKIQTKVPMSMELIRRSGLNAEAVAQRNMLQSMGNREDKAFLAGSGSAFEPRGILNWVAAANKFNATQAGGAATLTEVQSDLRDAIGNLTDNNVPLTRAAWFESFRSRNFKAFSLRDTEDRPLFREELTAATPSLHGQRIYYTNNIPNNLGGGSNESRVYLVDMDSAWLAEEGGLFIRASSEAAFTDASGNLVSAFDKGLMVIIIERFHDLVLVHDVAATVIEAVKWGA